MCSSRDALALGDGVHSAEDFAGCRSRPTAIRYIATYENDYCDDPSPRRSILPRASFLTTTSLIATRGCHNRCGFCYLATDGLRMPYRMRHPQQVAAEFAADKQPYAVFIDNNLGSRRDYLHQLCAALRPLNKFGVRQLLLMSPTIQVSFATWLWLDAQEYSLVSNHSPINNLVDAHKKTPKTSDYARRVRILHDYGIQVNGSFVLGFDQRPQRCICADSRLD